MDGDLGGTWRKSSNLFFHDQSFGVGLGLPAVEQILEQHGGGSAPEKVRE